MSSHSTDEFSLITRFFSDIGKLGESFAEKSPITLGIGDDCAVLQLPVNQELCLSIDTLVSGVHFPEDISSYSLGCRSLAVSLSDLAAMGAEPVAFTLALTLPDSNAEWLKGFSQGLSQVANQYDIRLIGGDTTKGPLTISIQVHGLVPAGKAIKRSGARPGDIICVSGTLGDAGGALDFLHLARASSEQSDSVQYLLGRYFYPQPKVVLGQMLRDVATAAIDISDGLLADYNHIARASGVGGVFYESNIPISNELNLEMGENALSLALSAGDDYELCFCLSESAYLNLKDSAAFKSVRNIGFVTEDLGLRMIGGDGVEHVLSPKGYRHF